MPTPYSSMTGSIGDLLRKIEESRKTSPAAVKPGAETTAPTREAISQPFQTPESIGTDRTVSVRPEGVTSPGTPSGAPTVSPTALAGGGMPAGMPGGMVRLAAPVQAPMGMPAVGPSVGTPEANLAPGAVTPAASPMPSPGPAPFPVNGRGVPVSANLGQQLTPSVSTSQPWSPHPMIAPAPARIGAMVTDPGNGNYPQPQPSPGNGLSMARPYSAPQPTPVQNQGRTSIDLGATLAQLLKPLFSLFGR